MALRNIILSLLMLALGGGGAVMIVKMKPVAQKVKIPNLGVLVERQRYATSTQDARVEGHGVVEPAQRMSLTAQVSGVVTRVHPKLSAGGRMERGVKLVQIDPTDYGLAIAEAKARVKIAEQEVALEAGRKRAAEREWEMMKRGGQLGDVSDAARARALREPQSEIARHNLKIARNALQRARVGYTRTTLKAPFNAVVLNESIDQGQLVGPGAPIAQLAGTDAFWIKTSISTSELGWIDFPPNYTKRGRSTPRGSRAIVRHDVGAYVIEREGYVLRQLTQVESTGRMAQVIIEVPDPLGLKGELKPLLLGAQVEVDIIGRSIDRVIEIPRAALREGDTVWLFRDARPQDDRSEESASVGIKEAQPQVRYLNGALEVRSVKVLRKRRDTVLISEGLEDTDWVVTSRIPTPVPNMKLRVNVQLDRAP